MAKHVVVILLLAIFHALRICHGRQGLPALTSLFYLVEGGVSLQSGLIHHAPPVRAALTHGYTVVAVKSLATPAIAILHAGNILSCMGVTGEKKHG